jgi:Predicted phosphohydrolases
MSFFIFIFIFYTLINTYIFIKGWKALSSGSTVLRIIYSLVFFIVYISFTLAMLGRNQIPLPIQKVAYMMGTGWLAYILYLTLYFLLTDLLYLVNKKNVFIPKKWTQKTAWSKIQTLSGYILVSILLSYGYYNFTHPSVVEKDIHISKSGNQYKDLKIVAFSDLHLGITVDKGRLKKFVQLINTQNPDLILIAGDIIDNNLYPLNKEKMWEELNNLQAPMGVHACLGNHEYLSGIKGSLEFLQRTKLNVLVDEAILIDESLYIVGRNDQQGGKRSPLDVIIKDIDRRKPVILLDHKPLHLEDAKKNNIDLQLSGHTHNGQLFPMNHIVRMIFELPYGYMQDGNTHYYVSSGLGLWGPQYRIGTRSEIVIFNIKFESSGFSD